MVAINDIEIDEDDVVSIVDTEDEINKYYDGKESNRKKLLDTLKMNEVKLKRYIKECKKLNKKVEILEEERSTKK
jgi:hypothetical protein